LLYLGCSDGNAANYYVSQPPLTQAIKKREDETGWALFTWTVGLQG